MTPCSRRSFLKYGAAGPAAGSILARADGTNARLAADGEFRRGGMIYRPLGKTGMNVSLLSFGSHTDHAYKVKTKLGDALTQEGQARRDRHLAKAFDLGVNFTDVYQNAGQFEPLARAVKGRRDKIHISASLTVREPIGQNIEYACKLYDGYVDLYRVHFLPMHSEPEPLYLENWDVLRRAKEAGKVRAIGVSCHTEQHMLQALRHLEGVDYVVFPYNFIHAKADYSEFLPAATARGIGLIAMKPLAAGSIANLDPRLKNAVKPEDSQFQLYNSRDRAILPAVVAELTKTLNQLPDETLCQAAIRYVYSRRFLSCTWTGMFDDRFVDDNYAALADYDRMRKEEHAALDAARKLKLIAGANWLPHYYRWLDGWVPEAAWGA